MELKGKTILITGGSTGIGLESAKQFSDRGANIIITGRNQDKLDRARALYPSIVAIQSDVSDIEDVEELFDTVDRMGGIDILYNNAGVGSEPLNLGDMTDQHYSDAAYEMSVNYLGVIRIVNTFINMLQSRKEAAIINTTSVLSYLPSLIVPTYSASKAALRFYTESLRQHLKIAGSSIKVFELLPPLVDTDLTSGFDAPKMSAENVVRRLVSGISKDQYTIRVGGARALYLIHRLFPNAAFSLLNPKKINRLLTEKLI